MAATLAVGAFALLAAGLAHADVTGAVGANLAGGADTNPLAAQDGNPAIGLDEFTVVRANLRGRYLGPRTDHLLSYGFTGTFFATNKEADGYVNELLWRLTAAPTGRTELHASAGASYGYLNSINPLAAVGAQNPQNIATAGFVSTPTGPVRYVGASANANGIYRPDGKNTWAELTSVTTFVPVKGDAARSLVLFQNGHYERLRGRNVLTLEAMAGYFQSDAFSFMPAPGIISQLPATKIIEGEVLVGWRHEFSPATYVAASGGVLLFDAVGADQLSFEPIAFAGVHHQTPTVLAELTISQAAEFNVYVGQPLLIDGVVGRLVVPLDRLQRLRVVGVGSAQRQWALTPEFAAAIDLVAGDVGLVFQPSQRPFLASLEYTVQDQVGHTIGPPGASTTFPSLHRQIVMLTLSATWGTDPTLR